MFFKSSLLFMSVSNLIWININNEHEKTHVNFSFDIMLMGREKEWNSYKDLLGKSIGKRVVVKKKMR
jgi:hypothetical protein